MLIAKLLDAQLAEAARQAAEEIALGRHPCTHRLAGKVEASAGVRPTCAIGEALKPLVVGTRGFEWVVEWSMQGNPKPGYVATSPGAELDICVPPQPNQTGQGRPPPRTGS